MENSETDGPNPTIPANTGHRVARERNPFAACGRTVSYLMNIPNLARLPFGQMTRLVVGQINRNHYFFVVDNANVICGYCGWTQASREQADAWLERNVDIGTEHSTTGPVSVINIWQASSTKANAVIIGALRGMLHPSTELVVAKRFYPDGTIRPVRLPITRMQLKAGRLQRSNQTG
jgi:hemolysin-activating ACP:hemolysin acyltransferase